MDLTGNFCLSGSNKRTYNDICDAVVPEGLSAAYQAIADRMLYLLWSKERIFADLYLQLKKQSKMSRRQKPKKGVFAQALTDVEHMPKGRYQYRESGTLINKAKNIGRNDPCPCGRKKQVKDDAGNITMVPVKAKNCHFPNL
jgi:hypothetical protein